MRIKTYDHGLTFLEVIFGWLAFLGFLWAFIGIITVSDVSEPSINTYPAQYASSLFHIDQNKPYRLTIGSSITGDVGSMNGSFAFFLLGGAGSVSGSIQPGQAVKLGMTNGNANYIATIPYNEVAFVISKTKPSNAIFTFRHSDVDLRGTLHSCWNAIPWNCDIYGVAPLSSTSFWRQWRYGNVADFIQKYVSNVRLTVTPAEYHSYLYGA